MSAHASAIMIAALEKNKNNADAVTVQIPTRRRHPTSERV